MKVCKLCKVKKHLTEFHKNKRSSKGVLNRCKACANKIITEKYYKYNLTPEQKEKFNNFQFGKGTVVIVLERDKYACVKCGLSNEEHKKLFKRRLTIDHIDNSGRFTEKHLKNNALDNLQTLCLPCHGRKDHRRKSQ